MKSSGRVIQSVPTCPACGRSTVRVDDDSRRCEHCDRVWHLAFSHRNDLGRSCPALWWHLLETKPRTMGAPA